MNDSVLSRLSERLGATETLNASEDLEEDVGAFGCLRGLRDRALMLELRLKDGRIVALSYALLDRATFDPSDGIRLQFSDQEVHLSGRALNQPSPAGLSVFSAIVRHRASWIRESSRADAFESLTGVTIVESISIHKR